VWGAGLARLAGPVSSAPMPLGIGALAAAGVFTLGSLGVAAWARSDSADEPSAGAPTSSSSDAVSGLPVLETSEPVVVAPSGSPPRATFPLPAAEGDEQEEHAVESAFATLRGRFVASDGSALSGIAYQLRLGGAQTGTGIPLNPPRPPDWEDLTGESASDGSFEIVFSPVPYYGLDFSASATGLSGVSWDADDLESGDVHDLGEVVLYRTATLFGRIIDESGAPLTGITWRVQSTPSSEALARSGYRSGGCQSDPLQATYRLEGLLPGLDRILLRSDTSDHQILDLEFSEGAVVEQDLVYRGADPLTRLAVSPSVARIRGASVAASALRLVDADGRELAARERTDSGIGFLFDGLARGGLYRLEVVDPRFEFVQMEGLSGGQAVRPELRGSSAFVLTVVDGPTQEPIASYSAEVELRNVNFFPRGFQASKEGEELVGGRIERCVAGDYILRVTAGGQFGETLVDGLAPGETRFVRVELWPGVRIEGRVLDEAGAPHAGLEILAVRPAQLEDGEDSMVARKGHIVSPPERVRFELASSRTDADGFFLLDLQKAEVVLLRAANAVGTIPLGEPLVLVAGETRTGLEFHLARNGSLRGQIRAPQDRDPSGHRIALVWNPGETVELLDPLELGPEGTFTFDGLRPGPYRVYFKAPEQGRFRSNGAGTSWVGESTCFGEDGLWNAHWLGDVVVAAGQEIAPEFQVSAADWPGALELSLQVNESPAKEWDVRLFQAGDCDFESMSDVRGTVGPLTLFAGSWFLEVTDPLTGWTHAFPDPIVVQPAQLTRQVLTVERP
ncbi:MAG: hypothetical protein ABL998_09325, partial [Planctomycetota bacterium]